jgi:nucleoside-diphosphate-sugar epimerase
MKILVIGGAGYVGSELVPALLRDKHAVTVYDTLSYGNPFTEILLAENLDVIVGDIRNVDKLVTIAREHEAVIHLACISNDPSFELDPKLGKSINLDCFKPLLLGILDSKVQKFVYASSSSVYGIKEELGVDETTNCEPITDYSKFKLQCEKILFDVDPNYEFTIVRPATVCGVGRRQRFDVVVNILSASAFVNNEIRIFGGAQLRPNIHISDMVRFYQTILSNSGQAVDRQIFNAGWENLSVNEIAKTVAKAFPGATLKTVPSNDNRSYHIVSEKAREVLGFVPKFTVADAVNDLKKAFQEERYFSPFGNPEYHNIKKIQMDEKWK